MKPNQRIETLRAAYAERRIPPAPIQDSRRGYVVLALVLVLIVALFWFAPDAAIVGRI